MLSQLISKRYCADLNFITLGIKSLYQCKNRTLATQVIAFTEPAVYILRFKLVVVCRSFVEWSVSYGTLIYIVLGDPSFWLENKRLVIEQRASKKKCFPEFHLFDQVELWGTVMFTGFFSHPEPWNMMSCRSIFPPVLEHQQQGHLTHDVMSHLLIALMQRKSMQIDDLHCLTCFHFKKHPLCCRQ